MLNFFFSPVISELHLNPLSDINFNHKFPPQTQKSRLTNDNNYYPTNTAHTTATSTQNTIMPNMALTTSAATDPIAAYHASLATYYTSLGHMTLRWYERESLILLHQYLPRDPSAFVSQGAYPFPLMLLAAIEGSSSSFPKADEMVTKPEPGSQHEPEPKHPEPEPKHLKSKPKQHEPEPKHTEPTFVSSLSLQRYFLRSAHKLVRSVFTSMRWAK
ncbi:hypothetical protein N0V90_000600 [Kalmusia sp. IMI 367209]|nr:hypothetical protein N0V90_000600 [Kalmusia sp. IMI 367209]